MNTRTIRKKRPKKAQKRRRKLPGLYAGNDRRDEKYLDFLYSGDQRLKVYVYEAVDDWPVPPFLFDCYPFPELEDRIRDEYGAGEYAIMIRRGDGTMLFSAILAIGVPLNWQPRKWG